MGAEHLQQSIKGNLRDTITHLEDGLDSVRSALKTFEALPSASTNIPMQADAQIAACTERLENCGDDWYAVVQDVASELRQLLHG